MTFEEMICYEFGPTGTIFAEYAIRATSFSSPVNESIVRYECIHIAYSYRDEFKS